MRLLFVLALAVGALAVLDQENLVGYSFEEYVVDFGKYYNTWDERRTHETTFYFNLHEIIRHNADQTQTYKKGVNQFTDMSEEEVERFFGYNMAEAIENKKNRKSMPALDLNSMVPVDQLPESVDWRTKGIITPVKNQGACGSCWAFGAVACIESNVIQNTGKTVILSTQNVVSCSKNPQHCGGTGGCGGSTAELAFDTVKQTGIAAEKDYPYVAQTGTCKETVPKTAKIDGFVQLPENNYTALMNAIASVGPLAVNVAANSWSSYRSGIFTGCPSFTSNIVINHVVQLVGYGVDNGRPYWLIRNSWGSSWGEQGYMRLDRHADGDMKKWCGIDRNPQDGTGCDGGPAQVTVCGSCGIWYDSSFPTGGRLL
jgi:cathepsin L